MSIYDTIAVLGGDARSRALAKRLTIYGAHVRTFALGTFENEQITEVFQSPEEAVKGCLAVVLPVPSFDREGKLYCPLSQSKERPNAKELAAWIERYGVKYVFAARLNASSRESLEKEGIVVSDMMHWEDVARRNAVPSAEGAIALAMAHLPVTLEGARVAVLGYGRIATVLHARLSAFGAYVTVGARKQADFERARANGAVALDLRDPLAVATLCDGYDVIFNTVPAPILPGTLLENLPKKTLLMELASAPGGWDHTAPVHATVIDAPGIPAKYAPVTAGEILADAIAIRLRGGAV